MVLWSTIMANQTECVICGKNQKHTWIKNRCFTYPCSFLQQQLFRSTVCCTIRLTAYLLAYEYTSPLYTKIKVSSEMRYVGLLKKTSIRVPFDKIRRDCLHIWSILHLSYNSTVIMRCAESRVAAITLGYKATFIPTRHHMPYFLLALL